MRNITACPACTNDQLDLLVDMGEIPQSGSLLETPEESYPRLNMMFEYCPRCGLIRRRLASPRELRDYTHTNRATGSRQPEYIATIAMELRTRVSNYSDLIVEVGANDGAFLDVLSRLGFNNLLAVEPSNECAALCAAKDHLVETVYLDCSTAESIRRKYGAAAAVVCRHTLEHVPDPLAMLEAMKRLLGDGGSLFVEVPDARNITHDLRIHELWEEHLHYFTFENLSLLLKRSNLGVEEAVRMACRGSANFLIWCRELSTRGEPVGLPAACSADVAACGSLKARWSELNKRILGGTHDWPKPVAFIGISHPQSNFLLFSGLGPRIDFLVDDDPAKIGCYAPVPQPVLIISSEQLINEHPPGTLVRGAFGYHDWMDRIEKALVQRHVVVVEPYPPLEETTHD